MKEAGKEERAEFKAQIVVRLFFSFHAAYMLESYGWLAVLLSTIDSNCTRARTAGWLYC